MEITQEIFGFTPEEEGEAVIVYTMTAPDGMSASVTNVGAALVSLRTAGTDGVLREIVVDSAPLVVNRVWEARVEVNRVVFSTTYATDDGTLALEVAYHLGDDGALEIVFGIVCNADAPMEVDLAVCTRFDIAPDDRCFEVKDWRRNILAEAGVVSGLETGIEMRVLTSLPRICVYGSGTCETEQAASVTSGLSGIPAPPNATGIPTTLTIAPGEREIQKIVYKFGTTA